MKDRTMLYRVDTTSGVLQLADTTTTEESLYEVDLEDWVEQAPGLLGEDLLVVGRQVEIDGGRDRLDLLAVDLLGSLVVIELKRDLVGGDADLQALRYASMIAGWTHETIRGLAEAYWRSSSQDRGPFTKELDAFCDAGYELNGTQRILLVGHHVHPRVATTALWLREHGLDIRVLGVDLYKDEDRLYLAPNTIIPVVTEDAVAATPKPAGADKEWRRDGRGWHLEVQLADDGRVLLEAVMSLIGAAVPEAEGPHWQQKNYISWRRGGRGWIRAYTDNPHQIALMVYGLGHLTVEEVALRVGLPAREDADSNQVSRVSRGRRPGHLWVILKSQIDLENVANGLSGVLREAWERFSAGA